MSQFKELLNILDLEEIGENKYRGYSLDIGSPQVYGGQAIAQSLQASGKSVPQDRMLHSMHSYFLSPGNMEKEIIFEVDVIKDGRTFNNRRVLAKQGDRNIFLLAASYQIAEEGFSHHAPMPNVAQPESLSSFPEIFAKVAAENNIKPKGIYSEDSSIQFKPVEHFNITNPGIRAPKSHVWFKANGDLPDNQALRKILLSYASDFNLLMTSLFPHNVTLFTTPMRIASLDHAMWFHRDIIDDDWMLYTVDSSNASGARGFCSGKIFSRDGVLLASTVQEGLIRKM